MKRSAWMEMAVYAISIFSNDGTLDESELDCLLGLATSDGIVDEDERRVLGRILDRVDVRRVSPELWRRIGDVRLEMVV